MILLVLLLLLGSIVTGENEFAWLFLSFFFLKRYLVFNGFFLKYDRETCHSLLC